MEGESLFNDSSSIVLFKIFFDMVKRLAQGKPGSQLGMGAEALDIAGNIVWLTVGASRPFSPLTRPASAFGFHGEPAMRAAQCCHVHRAPGHGQAGQPAGHGRPGLDSAGNIVRLTVGASHPSSLFPPVSSPSASG